MGDDTSVIVGACVAADARAELPKLTGLARQQLSCKDPRSSTDSTGMITYGTRLRGFVVSCVGLSAELARTQMITKRLEAKEHRVERLLRCRKLTLLRWRGHQMEGAFSAESCMEFIAPCYSGGISSSSLSLEKVSCALRTSFRPGPTASPFSLTMLATLTFSRSTASLAC